MSEQPAAADSPEKGLDPAARNSFTVDRIPADEINAEAVEIRNSSVQSVSASDLEIHQSAVNRIDGGSVWLRQSAAGAVTGDQVHVRESAVGVARSQDVALNGVVGIGIAESMHIEDGGAAVLLSNEIRGESIRSAILLANQVEGEVVTLLDTPRAVLAGMVSGIAVGLVLLVGRLLIRGRR